VFDFWLVTVYFLKKIQMTIRQHTLLTAFLNEWFETHEKSFTFIYEYDPFDRYQRIVEHEYDSSQRYAFPHLLHAKKKMAVLGSIPARAGDVKLEAKDVQRMYTTQIYPKGAMRRGGHNIVVHSEDQIHDEAFIDEFFREGGIFSRLFETM